MEYGILEIVATSSQSRLVITSTLREFIFHHVVIAHPFHRHHQKKFRHNKKLIFRVVILLRSYGTEIEERKRTNRSSTQIRTTTLPLIKTNYAVKPAPVQDAENAKNVSGPLDVSAASNQPPFGNLIQIRRPL